jgi:hypothetical protein
MSARRLLALLVVVVFGLLLANPTAMSRTGTPHTRATSWYDDAGNPDDGIDDDDPDGVVDGDDDNWDRPVGHGHLVATAGTAGGGGGSDADTDTSGKQLSRTEVGLRFARVALLRAWISFFSLR